MKFSIALMASLFLSQANACPDLVGRYKQCRSEIRPIKGEYIVEQHQENSSEIYEVEYYDDETGESRKDVLMTDNSMQTRKEKIPRVGVKVKLEVKSRCEKNAVISDADVYFLGAKVGHMVSTIFVEDGKLKSNVDGSYLSKEVHKRIVCDVKE